jgi:hypothetical protein
MPVLNRREAAALAFFFPQAAGAASLSSDFPREDSKLAYEAVRVAHFDEKKLKELVDAHPSLANAAWDWGFGDWETPLGSAAHMGRRAIAEYLLVKGAHLTIFAAAMLGMTDAVKAMVTAQPGIQRGLGPHGIPLLTHAKAGGTQALATFAYLESLGDAGNGPQVVPVSEDRRNRTLGNYEIGGRRMQVKLAKNGTLQIEVDGAARTLHHKGEDVYFPAGAPSVGFRFEFKEGKSTGFTFLNPDAVTTARRVE